MQDLGSQTGTLPQQQTSLVNDRLFFNNLSSLVPSVQPVKGEHIIAIFIIKKASLVFFCFMVLFIKHFVLRFERDSVLRFLARSNGYQAMLFTFIFLSLYCFNLTIWHVLFIVSELRAAVGQIVTTEKSHFAVDANKVCWSKVPC